MRMFLHPIWGFYALVALFLVLAIGFGLRWWFGLLFALIFALFPLLAWIAKQTPRRSA